MKITQGPLAGLLIIEPKQFADNRGYFQESYQQKRYEEAGIPLFVQDNIARSKKHVLRGLHYQLPHTQGKLIYVTRGSIWDVAVDIRVSSPTFGQWFGIHLNDENHTQLYIPPGFAHGYCVLSEEADCHYKCTDYYFPQSEQGISWDDKDLNISWPISSAILSDKDKIFPPLSLVPREKLYA
jgi:dTDP-4-dehydrorhamnose 3,5-epimerase